VRGWLTGTLAALVAALLVAPAAATQTTWRAFRHPAFGFSLSYPEGWEAASEDGPIAFMVVGPAPAGVDGLRLSVNVTTERVAPDLTVDRFEALSESRMGQLFQSYTRLRTDRLTLAGHRAILRYYTWKRNDGLEVYQMQLHLVASGRAYVVTGTTAARSAQLRSEADLLLRIVSSFRP